MGSESKYKSSEHCSIRPNTPDTLAKNSGRRAGDLGLSFGPILQRSFYLAVK